MEVYNGLIVNIKFNELSEVKKIKVCPNCDDYNYSKNFCSSCGTKSIEKEITKKYYNSWFNVFYKYKLKTSLKCLSDTYLSLNKNTDILYQEKYCTSGYIKEFSSTESYSDGSFKLDIKDYSDMINKFKEYYKDLFDALGSEGIVYSIESSVLLLDLDSE